MSCPKRFGKLRLETGKLDIYAPCCVFTYLNLDPFHDFYQYNTIIKQKKIALKSEDFVLLRIMIIFDE